MSTSAPIRLLRPLPLHLGATNWFPGHMAKGLREMRQRLRKVDVVVEVRDARIPFTSANPMLERLVLSNGASQRQIQQRIILLNKCDLAEPAKTREMARIIERKSNAVRIPRQDVVGGHSVDAADWRLPPPETKVYQTHMNDHGSLRPMLKMLRKRALDDPLRYPTMTLLMVGMPNLGKSSLINALRNVGNRGSKAAATGAQPGVTRSLAATPIRIIDDPRIYLLDTPGIMDPTISDPDKSLRLALCGGIRDHLVGLPTLAEYLVWKLGQIGRTKPLEDVFRIPHEALDSYYYETENSIPFYALLDHVGRVRGAVGKGGIPNRERAAGMMVQAFRDGKLGRFSLDTSVDAEALTKCEVATSETPLSDGSDIFPASNFRRQTDLQTRLDEK